MPIGPHVEKHVDRIQEGLLQLRDHLIAAWSRVQPRSALSSGEAELYAGMRGISETLGFVHLMREFQSNDWGRIVHRVDASACRATMLRRRCGGLKHITVKSLWVQEAVRVYSIEIDRVPKRCDACPRPCISIQRGRTEETPDRVECVQRRRGRGLTSGL